MEDTKPWYLSKGVLGALASAIVGILMIAGVGGAEAERETLTKILMEIGATVAAVVALWGRLFAKKQIK